MNETLVAGPLLVLGFILLVFTAAMCVVLAVGWMMCRAVDRYTVEHRPVSDRMVELWQEQIDDEQDLC